jgi:hypothetical protein
MVLSSEVKFISVGLIATRISYCTLVNFVSCILLNISHIVKNAYCDALCVFRPTSFFCGISTFFKVLSRKFGFIFLWSGDGIYINCSSSIEPPMSHVIRMNSVVSEIKQSAWHVETRILERFIVPIWWTYACTLVVTYGFNAMESVTWFMFYEYCIWLSYILVWHELAVAAE